MSDLILSNFSSYFSIFAVLNLGYATSQLFRDALDGNILQLSDLKNSILKDVDVLSARIELLSWSDKPKVARRLENFKNDFNIDLQKIVDNKVEAAEFVNGFKSMFLITSLYSFTFLILAGFQEQSKVNNNIYIYNLMHFLNVSLIIFDFFIYKRSFKKYFNKTIKPFKVSIIYFCGIIIFLMLSYVLNKFLVIPSAVATGVSVGLFVAISPYLVHFLKSYFHNSKYKIDGLIFMTKQYELLAKINTYVDYKEQDDLNSSV